MINALKERRKRQTRRKVSDLHHGFLDYCKASNKDIDVFISKNSKFKIGNILWVRETFDKVTYEFVYKADDNSGYEFLSAIRWKPSIHMPKVAARIFLEVTNIKVERLKDISEEDAIAEGVFQHSDYGSTGYVHYGRTDEALTDIDAVYSFETLWDSINGKDSWEKNPWVWVYDFKVVDKPANFLS